MMSCVVFIAAFCFVSMVTGQGVNNKTAENYVKCLTNLQCKKEITQRVIVDNTTYCCQQGRILSIHFGFDRALIRMSQALSRMFYNTVMKDTFPGIVNLNSNSKDSNSDDKNGVKVDSSASDSDNSFSDSDSIDTRSDSDSMETPSIRDFLDRFRSFVDSRSIWEYLDGIDNRDNDGQNTRGMGDEYQAIASQYLNAAGGFKDTWAELETKRDSKRAINNPEKRRLASIKNARGDSRKEKLIRKRLTTELDVAENVQYRSGKDGWEDGFYDFLRKNYLGQDETWITQETNVENLKKRDEDQIPNTIYADILKRDTGFNYENEGNQRQNRDLDTPNSQFSERRLERQEEANNAAARRQLIKDPKPGVINTPKAQVGPLPAAQDNGKKYLQCKCLIGN